MRHEEKKDKKKQVELSSINNLIDKLGACKSMKETRLTNKQSEEVITLLADQRTTLADKREALR